MSSTDSHTLIRRYFEVWNGGDIDVLDDLLDPAYINHSSGMPTPPPPGPDGLKPVVQALRGAFSDLNYDVHQVVVENGMAAVRSTMTGTHDGSLFGMPPTGRSVEVTQMQFERIADGRLAEHWRTTDDLTLMRQLGQIPDAG